MDVRRLFPLMVCMLGFAWLVPVGAQGPDEKGAVLRTDFEPTPAPRQTPAAPIATTTPPARKSDSAMPDYVRSMFGNDFQAPDPANPNARRGLGSDEVPDVNRDLALTPAAGQWLVMLISYPGDKGAALARKMCLEVRSKNRVPAYVFVYGAEERRKERERVLKIVEEQQKFFREKNLTPFETPTIRHKFIELQHTVLIGGYPDVDAANRALNDMRKWAQPDPKVVDLEVKYTETRDPNTNKLVDAKRVYVNPFQRAFACRNPTIKTETQEAPKLDVAALRRLNADESYSLFNCKKPYTLAVKEFQTQFRMQDKDTSMALWDAFVSKGAESKDSAKLNAHSLCEALVKSRLPAFVLHSKFSSTVTVGEFDGPDDPALKSMQQTLGARFREPVFAQIQFFYHPVPMAVPR